jgi:hypothetical protein
MAIERRIGLTLIAALFVLTSCSTSSAGTSPSTSTTELVSTTAAPTSTDAPLLEFDGHTTSRLESVDEFDAFARSGVGNQSVVKFSIPDIRNTTDVHWMDSSFYELHDEWYWFHLINGVPIAGSPTPPAEGFSFESVEDVYAWAESTSSSELPLGLQFVDSRSFGRRLYSPEFYELALDADPRVFGVGSLVRFGATENSSNDRWLVELEYSDDVSPTEVELFFDRLTPSLPEEIGSNLEWVIRSPHQESVAMRMVAESLPYADRVVRYNELVPQGQVSVYNEGIAAGRLLFVDGDATQLTDAQDTDILIMENVPDWLPPANALITSSPQTPLAHVNLLARNRGIPNASQAGLLDDAQIRQAARVRAPAIVRSSGTNSLEVVLITEEEFRRWRSLDSRSTIAVPPVDPAGIPLVVELEPLASTIGSEARVDEWRPVIGGKSAGFLALLAADGVTTPETPLAITVRPYLEHLESVQEALSAMLSNSDFESSPRVRFLLLEGPKDFAEEYPNEDDIDFATSFETKHPPGAMLGDVLAAGGFKDYFRDAPMNEATLSELTTILEEQFGSYADTQGLRFRSSSSVEDIEGFSGAGLYDSNTGFLKPEAQADEGDHKKTVERTIKKTWASYWSFEAFEERRRERVDHESGAMAVLVHARFDDPLEVNNGVATFTLLPDVSEDLAVAKINVQLGDESVTNPDPLSGELPEVHTVHIGSEGQVTIVRNERSTLSPDTDVLKNDEIDELVAQLQSVALLWRSRVNVALPSEQQIQTLTLDYEFKTMAPGWPARANGDNRPTRLVLKQARSLDPGLRGLPSDVLDLPVPRDVLARARLVVEISCDAGDRTEVFTDSLLLPDIGYSVSPFVVGPVDIPDDSCERTVLHSSADQYLIELLVSSSMSSE